MKISGHLACGVVEKDSCVAEYKEEEQKRRDRTERSIQLE